MNEGAPGHGSPTARPKGSRTTTVLAGVATLVAAAACAFAGLALTQARHNQTALLESKGVAADLADRLAAVESTTSSTRSSIDDAQSSLQDAQSSITELRGTLGALDDPTSGIADLATRLDSIESDLVDTNSSIAGLSSAMADALGQLTDCVNTYMKTVGDAGVGRYTYRFC